jgi:hypothetical protein
MIMGLFTHQIYYYLGKSAAIGGIMTNPIIPIIPKEKDDSELAENIIQRDTFDKIIKSVYDIMVDYARIQDTYINKSHPIAVGNVLFWFETNEKTQESYIKYDKNVISWNEDVILSDIDLHMHSLYYNPTI